MITPIPPPSQSFLSKSFSTLPPPLSPSRSFNALFRDTLLDHVQDTLPNSQISDVWKGALNMAMWGLRSAGHSIIKLWESLGNPPCGLKIPLSTKKVLPCIVSKGLASHCKAKMIGRGLTNEKPPFLLLPNQTKLAVPCDMKCIRDVYI